MNLNHLKVIELANVLAGPSVGMFFAELGAEVIKIENSLTGGDITRQWKLPQENEKREYSAYYCSTNWNKKVLMRDLNRKDHQREIQGFIAEADIVISNFKSSTAKQWGMDYGSLKTLNPRMIFAHLTGFGEEVVRPAFDVVLQAEAGFLFMSGEEGRPPSKMPVALIDLLAAHQLKEGILLGLLQREKTGKGCLVSTSLLEAAIASLANQATNWLMTGFIPQRIGSRHPNIAPYGDVFVTKDEKLIVLAAGTEKQFERLCSCLQMPGLATDPRFCTNRERVANRKVLKGALEPLFLNFNRKELMDLFREFQVPAGSIRNMKEVFEMEKAKEMILEEIMPDGEISRRVKTVAFKLNK